MFNTAKKVAEVQAQIQKLQLELSMTQSLAQSLSQYGVEQIKQICPYYDEQLKENKQKIHRNIERPPQHVAGWNENEWEKWKEWANNFAASQNREDEKDRAYLRVGEGTVQASPDIVVPVYIPFIGKNKTIVIRSSGATRSDQGLELLQSLVVRTAMMFPHRSGYTLLDPAGNGIAFPMRRGLPMVREATSDTRRDLEPVLVDIQRIIATYLDASVTSFENVHQEKRLDERFQFVFAADFPNQYDRRAIEALQSIGNTGTAAGVYLFIHQNMQYDMQYDMQHDISMDTFKNAFYIDLTGPITSIKDFAVQIDHVPLPDVQKQVFLALEQAKPREFVMNWDKVIGLPEDQWWKGNDPNKVHNHGKDIIETKIGKQINNDDLTIWFGTNSDGRPCSHGILGAMTGAGKSNFFHTLISGLAIRYSPADLQMYLIDGKDGVEFKSYRDLPHANVISLCSSSELSCSVLIELIAEKERRNNLFKKVGRNVQSFTEYYEQVEKVAASSDQSMKHLPLKHLPRILLLIDEYQQLFEDDRDGVASRYLLQLAQQGRSVGIHMLLASQHFGAPGMLYKDHIFGNVHLRMAMQMTDADIQALSEFDRNGKDAIARTCDRPGKIVINDNSGSGKHQAGKVALFKEEFQGELITKLQDKSHKEMPSLKKDVPTIVFDGKAQPSLLENRQLMSLLKLPAWLSAEQMEGYVRQPEQNGGLDVLDWFQAEHPHIAWFGQEFNVRGQASAILRQRTSENILIVGGANAPRYGILAAILASLSLTGRPEDTEFIVVDRSIPKTQWNETLHATCDTLLQPAGFTTTFTTDNTEVESLLDRLLDNLKQRQQISKEEEQINLPSIFIMMTELDRVNCLRRKEDAYGLSDSAIGEKLHRLLVEGPQAGLHFLLSFAGVRSMTSVLDERTTLVNFRHRIALQMSEDESFTFVRNRKATQLQNEGPKPICALYLDVESDSTTRFKPYTIDEDEDEDDIHPISILRNIQQIGRQLTQRR